MYNVIIVIIATAAALLWAFITSFILILALNNFGGLEIELTFNNFLMSYVLIVIFGNDWIRNPLKDFDKKS